MTSAGPAGKWEMRGIMAPTALAFSSSRPKGREKTVCAGISA
jgi:hypothetical protein